MKKTISRAMVTAILAAGLLFTAAPSSAVTYGFDCITNNAAASCAIGESQLSMTVSDYSATQVAFTFSNIGSEQSTIAEIYFDDKESAPVLNDIADLLYSTSGILFIEGASPPDLPGGTNIDPDFHVTAGLLAEAVSPAPKLGVNIGESMSVVFNLINGSGFAQVVAALESGALRVGLHVINFEKSVNNPLDSESFVNVKKVPEPGTLLLLGSGLLGLGLMRRRRS